MEFINFIITVISGLLAGSFLNASAYRIGQSMMNGSVSMFSPKRSTCPTCQHTLGILELIPVISYLIQDGKCKHCHTSISAQYPLVEIFTAIITTIISIKWGVEYQTLFVLVFCYALAVLFLIDLEYQLLPNLITLPLIMVGLWFNYQDGFVPLQDALIGTVAGYLVLWSVFWGYKYFKGIEGMGYGDFKLTAALGAWFGWQSLPILLLISSILGIVYFVVFIKDRNQAFAFGPFLSLAGIVWLFFNY